MLLSTHSVWREERFPISAGIVPVSWLVRRYLQQEHVKGESLSQRRKQGSNGKEHGACATHSRWREERLPISAGIVPVSRLSPSHLHKSNVMGESEKETKGAMGEEWEEQKKETEVCVAHSHWREERFPISAGIVPVSWLLLRSLHNSM